MCEERSTREDGSGRSNAKESSSEETRAVLFRTDGSDREPQSRSTRNRRMTRETAQDRLRSRSRCGAIDGTSRQEWITVKPKTPSSTRRLPQGDVRGCSGSSLFSAQISAHRRRTGWRDASWLLAQLAELLVEGATTAFTLWRRRRWE